MSFLPIVARELRVQARAKGTIRVRLGAAMVATLIVIVMSSWVLGAAGPSKIGHLMFMVLSWLALLYCLLEGPRLTSDCLSEEKRAGTLGLLFLTDLKGYDVVLGKLAATSLNSLYCLMAIVPALGVPILLGGVTMGEFWRLALVLLSALFFSLALGMAISAGSLDERGALIRTVGAVTLLTVGPVVLSLVGPAGLSALVPFGPGLAFASLFDKAYRTDPDIYWISLLLTNLFSWGCLLFASAHLPRAWQDEPIRKSGLSSPLERKAGDGRDRWRRIQLTRNPLIWLAGRHDAQRLPLWVLASVAAGSLALTLLFYPASVPVALGAFVGVLVFHELLAVWVAIRACYLLAVARDSGLLEVLLSTPISEKEIVQGHARALEEIFQGPIKMLLLVEGICLLAFPIGLYLTVQMDVFGCFLTLVLGGLILAVSIEGLYAAGWYGLWMGLKEKKPSTALTKVVIYFFILPLGLSLFCVVFWPLWALIRNLAVMNFSQNHLEKDFRRTASERFLGASEGTPDNPRKGLPELPRILPDRS